MSESLLQFDFEFDSWVGFQNRVAMPASQDFEHIVP
jgi:hypothetical protein